MTYDKTEKSKRRLSHGKIRSMVVGVAVSVLLIVALINFVSMLVEYNEMQAKKEMLLEEINDTKDNIEELEYWIDAPMDDDYIMKFAREKLDLYRADEIVFAGDAEVN